MVGWGSASQRDVVPNCGPWKAHHKAEGGVCGEETTREEKRGNNLKGRRKRKKRAKGSEVQCERLPITSKGLCLGASRPWGHPVFTYQVNKTQGHLKPPRAFLILRKVSFRLVQPWRDEQWRPLKPDCSSLHCWDPLWRVTRSSKRILFFFSYRQLCKYM